MNVLEMKNLKYYIKDQLLLDIENLAIQHDDRIGLVGRNGTGKTTLLEILAGLREPDEGSIVTEAATELLPQLKQTETTKSGGEVTQEYINKSLAKKTGILFADEPTTNLDTEHIEKLEKQLSRWRGAIIMVSHDRAFLDSLCTAIWELDGGHIHMYKGNYSVYNAQKELEIRQQENAYENYQQKKRQLENALEQKEQKAQRATKKPKSVSKSEASITGAKPYFAKKQKKLHKTAKAIETRLEKLEAVEKVKEHTPIKMGLPNQEKIAGRIVIRAEDAKADLADRTLWRPASFHIKGGDKIAILGRNGVGKTTLIKKIIAGDQNISISPALKIGYFSQNLDVLETDQTIMQNVSVTSEQDETLIRTVLARLHFYQDDVYKKVNVLSGGERVKVAFAKLFVSDVNLLILDEPTNFLDIEAVEALENLLKDYEGTILVVTHDRRFIQSIANRILSIENEEITLVDGSYEAFTNYKPEKEVNSQEQDLLLIETKITEILSKLSMEPTDRLEQEFQALLAEKRAITSKE
ncbi:Vga family ABC-F type ribosomal protection protein [Oceanobacillus massiliensis]|uniref:Vga family ABC-F type ribosomal protection protein n=1 Tax=Oceanobacillus massiliensis TaxID=1465765 RepID=UPI000289E132|nr:Vga family ABC-F type ribosomal protection protein [Oceanobacillus massiliensis]